MNQDDLRDLFRRYLLNTASDAERQRVHGLLVDQPELRAVLEDEGRRLGALDVLEEQPPTRDLTASVVQQLEHERAPEPRPLWRVLAPYGLIAATLVIAIGIMLPALSRARESARRATSQNNLKQLGLVMKMYASESKGQQYPPLAPYDGVWMVDLRAIYPEFVSDPSVFVSPNHPDAERLIEDLESLLAQDPVDWERASRIVAQSYVYPGWVVDDDADLTEFTRGVRQLARANYTENLTVGQKTFLRHREGVERFMITDINNPAASAKAQSTIPLVFENAYISQQNEPVGINVLYMDGHVEFIRFGERFPATEAARTAFPPPPLD